VPALETGIRNSLTKYLQSAQTHLGYPTDIHIEFGLVNVSGFRLALAADRMSGAIFEDLKVSTVVDLQAPGSMEAALLEIYRAIYESAGETRP
jgi:hypothetical protein